MTLHAGHCTTCDAPIWRTVTHPQTREVILLFPAPDSLYAVVERPDGNLTPGIGYEPPCAPALGSPSPVGPGTVTALVPAPARYAYWYTERYRTWLASWLTDELRLPEPDRLAILAQWEADRRAVEGVHA